MLPVRIGPVELMLILLIVVLVFGAGRIADLGGALGKSIREFRKSVKEDDEVKADSKSG